MSNNTLQARHERNAGFLLLAAAILALFLANGPWASSFHHVLETRLGPPMPRLGVMSVHQWIADAAMAVFFLLVGLEVKREWLAGRLSTPSDRRLPIAAAAAGMAVPALVYLGVTGFDPALLRGWAIPAATDIAFAIAVLAVLGCHAPPALKLLLVTIAVVDDIGAVIIIAAAYTANLDGVSLLAALALVATMVAMGRFGVRHLLPYLAGFILLWLMVLASGIHPTVAGVLAALTIPMGPDEKQSPLRRLEHAIHPLVMFVIVPLFGLASAGVAFDGGFAALGAPLPSGILLGLLIGKPVGVLGAMWACVRLRIAPLPRGIGWRHLAGAACLCGIGFTMSLFIGALAFPASPERVEAAKLGTLVGSLLSAFAGYLILRTAPTVAADASEKEQAEEIFSAD